MNWARPSRSRARAARVGRVLGTPTVLTVIWRWAMPKSLQRQSMAASTASILSRGSPMPMNTTWLGRWSITSRTLSTWSTISWTARERCSPPLPVAQKLQAIGQPTWLLTHTVSRPSAGMPTVSRLRPSWVPSNSLVVPSRATLRCSSRERPIQSKPASGGAAASCSRKALGSTLMASRLRAPLA